MWIIDATGADVQDPWYRLRSAFWCCSAPATCTQKAISSENISHLNYGSSFSSFSPIYNSL